MKNVFDKSQVYGNMSARDQRAVPTQTTTTPKEEIIIPPPMDFNTETYQGSIQQIMSENIGQYVYIEFLVGTQNIVTKTGELFSVGRSFVVLYETTDDTYILCDIFSIKFVTFFQPGQRPIIPS